MVSKNNASVVLFVSLNLLFFAFVNAHNKTCPKDTLKLGVCANLLNWLIGIRIGTPPKEPCCSLIQGLVDAEAAVCLCTAIKANILGIVLNIPVSLRLLLNNCGKKVPPGFQCA
ncbi:unnamed protein product [Fraxinus pennsylvanica]|uniref:Bifunctional inhibitor/plant lipid transfer protein/seed storage helical domain-containing protein n=1 Tax=Fraxinus pennsylvanica TaxID=56036 RepID=A0AAD1YQ77_9LAMI|nr:unnamed protein product [Fraxinus pennsylvanica]